MNMGYANEYRFKCPDHPAPSGAPMNTHGAWRGTESLAISDADWHATMHKCHGQNIVIVDGDSRTVFDYGETVRAV